MSRRIRVKLDWSNGPHEVNYASLLLEGAAAEDKVVEVTQKADLSDGASGSSKGSFYDDADSFIDDTELEEQFKNKRPSEKSHFRVGGLSDEETNLLPPEPRPPKKRRPKQDKPTHMEDPHFKLALVLLKEQVGARKRYAADLDPLLLNCATAARGAHPDQLFEADAQELLYELMPFSSVKAIAQKVRRMEHEAKIKGLEAVIEQTMPQLESAIGQCMAQAVEQGLEAAKKKVEAASQVIVAADNSTLLLTAAPVNHQIEQHGPVLQTTAPTTVATEPTAAVATVLPAAAPAEEPAVPIKPRFAWNTQVEGYWHTIVCAQMALLDMTSPHPPSTSHKKGAAAAAVAAAAAAAAAAVVDKKRIEFYKNHLKLWASEDIHPVIWQDLRKAYNRTVKQLKAKTSEAPKPKPTPKRAEGPTKSAAAATVQRKPADKAAEAPKRGPEAEAPNPRSPKRVSVQAPGPGPLKQSTEPGPLMSTVFDMCPAEYLQKWNAGERAMPQVLTEEEAAAASEQPNDADMLD